MINAYPLHWPPGWKRTQFRQRARFGTSFSNTRDNLMHELRLLGATNVIISSNIPIRLDGLPYAKFRVPEDPGIVVYFDLNGGQACFPCDRWDTIEDNIHAIELSVGALRGLERWGAKDMVAAAFRGFQALPEHTHEDTIPAKQKIDYFAGCNTPDEIKARRRNLSRDLHPDKGGKPEEFSEMMRQYDAKMKK